MGYNKLLERQIRRNLRDDPEIPEKFKKIFQAISDSYDHNSADRNMLERSLDISSGELNKANSKVRSALGELEEKNKDITDSINYAQKIQAAILPSQGYIKSLLPQSFVLFKPKDIVSGDFYWFAEKDGRAFAVAADCTGHGVPGAFMSMIGSSLLNETVIEKGITDPGQILQGIKNGVIKALRQTGGRLQQKDGMDMALCSFDLTSKTVQYAGAYNPLVIVRNGEVLETRADRMPIGIYEDDGGKTFITHDVQLEDGDSVYIYSDGFVDQFGGPKGKKFMGKRFRAALIEAQSLSMEEQGVMLDKLIEDWRTNPSQPGGESEQMDDILIVGVHI